MQHLTSTFPACLAHRIVRIRRCSFPGLRAAFALAAASLSAGAVGAQTVRRPTVPVVPVAHITTRDPALTAKPAVRAKAAAAPKGAAARSGAKGAAKPGAKLAVRPALDTALVAADSAASVMASLAGEVAAPAAGRSTAGYARYRSTRDSLAGELSRAGAERAKGVRVAVSLEDRELAVLDGADTLLVAPIAIGMDTTLRYGSRSWTFDTPRGKRSVLRKDANPVWIPPEWHYAEVANRKGLKLANLPANKPVVLGDGRKLVVRGGRAGIIENGAFAALPVDEEIVFGNTLYVPPPGSRNRRIEGELGRFRLDMGNGYMLHGTPHEDTIGDAATHGCIRLYDEDIEWLFQHVAVGTPVYIF